MINEIKLSVQKFSAKRNFNLLLLVLILVIAAFLRFYNTPERYGFDPDAIRDAIITAHGASTLQFPLTGPVSALGSFHFGPWYYAQLIVFKMVFPFDYSPWIYMSLASLVTVVFFYKIGALLGNKYFGLILASLAAISPAQIAPATGLSNPNLVIIQSVIAIYLFLILIKKKPSSWWALLLGIVIGIGINNHYQMLGLMILPILLLFTQSKRRLNYLVFSLLGVSFTFVPLIIFNLTNNNLITKGIADTLENRSINYVPNRWLIYIKTFWPKFWSYALGVPMIIGVLTMFSSIGSILFLYSKRKLNIEYILLIIAFAVIFVFLRYYPGEREVYYLLFLHPFIFILTGLLFYLTISSKNIMHKFLGIAGFMGFVIFIIISNISRFHSFESHTIAIDKATKISKNYPDNKISIYSCKGIEDSETQAVMFVLQNMNKLDDSGKKVGLLQKDCQKGSANNSKSEMINLSEVENLDNETWTNISPEKVFNHYAKWYQRN